MRRDVFQAIADPNRREILAVLAQQTLTLNGVAEKFHISRPAVSKHIKILSECGLVVTRQHGRERYCEVRPNKLLEVTEWVEQYRELWSQRLDSLDAYLLTVQKTSATISRSAQAKATKTLATPKVQLTFTAKKIKTKRTTKSTAIKK